MQKAIMERPIKFTVPLKREQKYYCKVRKKQGKYDIFKKSSDGQCLCQVRPVAEVEYDGRRMLVNHDIILYAKQLHHVLTKCLALFIAVKQ